MASNKNTNLVSFPAPDEPDAEQYARAETARKKALFEWADNVLAQLGLAERVARAQNDAELRRIALDTDDVYVALAIRDALHPAGRQRAEHFAGIKAGALKRLLQLRLNEMKRDRESKIRRGTRSRRTRDWTDGLKFDATGHVRPILANLILFLTEHPSWRGVLAYDEFSMRVVIRKRPPWGNEPPDAAWSDLHDTRVRVWFQREEINASLGDCGRAVLAAARNNTFHPVRDYLSSLTWDGIPRLDTWLSFYLRVEDTPFTRAIGPRWLIGAVARVFEPGSKVDHVLVLEGPQGKQKSEALRTIAVRDAWFTDRLSNIGTKDAAQEMSGVWLIEIAEMEAIIRATASSVKAFVARRVDRYRPPYGKHTIGTPRQCIFAGTINPSVGGYLRDPTGSRRIWPVLCPDTIELDALAHDRDQLWAEAITRYKAGARWWLETPELEALAAAEQEKRFAVDVWQEQIEQWLGNREETSVSEVLVQVFGYAPERQNRSAQMRVADILTRLGFSKIRYRGEGNRKYKYRRM